MTRVLLLKNKTVPVDSYEHHLSSNNFEPVFIPLIKHTHLPSQTIQLLQDKKYLDELQHIIVTSQRTVECLNESIMPKLTVEQLQLLRSKTVYTVGPATQHFLQRCGFTDVRGGLVAGNGDILADLIIDELLDDGCKDPSMYRDILFLVGETRRDIIPKKLESKGLTVQEVVTYKTESLGNNLERLKFHCEPSSWIVFFSSQGTEEIVDYLKTTSGRRVASIGPTTDKYLLSKGLSSDIVSAKPEPLSLVNAIINLQSM